jgi:hypothetical protein
MPSYLNSGERLPIMQGSPPSLVPHMMEWDRPPWNRWAFQHVRELLPTAEVWRGTGPVRELPRKERDLDGLAVTGTGGEPATLAQLLDQTYTDGFVVLKDGVIVYERYFNGMTPRTLHLSQSVAKSVTGAVAGILAGRSLLDVNALVTDYLPELRDTAWRGATLQQVLDMTTGVRFSEDYTDPHSDIGRSDVASGWKPIPPGSDPDFRWPRHMWELILSLTATERPHGELFAYRSIETDVLAFAMERATGRRLPQLVSEELWQKAGMEESASFTVDRAGYALADGGFNATLRDYARFGQLFLENGGGLIPSPWVESTRTGNHAIFHAPYTLTLPAGAYRNQFWIEDPVNRAIMARGVFGQLIYINWQHRLVAVKLSSWPDFLNTSFSNATLSAIHAIARELA